MIIITSLFFNKLIVYVPIYIPIYTHTHITYTHTHTNTHIFINIYKYYYFIVKCWKYKLYMHETVHITWKILKYYILLVLLFLKILKPPIHWNRTDQTEKNILNFSCSSATVSASQYLYRIQYMNICAYLILVHSYENNNFQIKKSNMFERSVGWFIWSV